MTGDQRNVAVIGCGRIGAPMLAWLHNKKQSFDIVGIEKNNELIGMLRSGNTGWFEEGLDESLKTNCPPIIHSSDVTPQFWENTAIAIICLGSPVDEYGEPQVDSIRKLCASIPKNVALVLRSTVPVGFTEDLSVLLARPIYFAPERILTGAALKELDTLPQVLGFPHGGLQLGQEHIMEFFTENFSTVHPCSLKEAELCKIGNNIIRYIEFTAGTQFSEAVEYYGEDWEKVRKLMTAGYDRGSMRMPSFTSSYCLNKDFYMLDKNIQPSLSLASAEYNQYYLLENLWNRAIDMEPEQSQFNVGILGWTYRPESDDDRDTIVEYLGAFLEPSSRMRRVTYFDPVKNPSEEEFKSRTGFGNHARQAASAQAVIDSSDIIFIATAHPQFEMGLNLSGKIIIDPSGLVNGNTRFVRWYD